MTAGAAVAKLEHSQKTPHEAFASWARDQLPPKEALGKRRQAASKKP